MVVVREARVRRGGRGPTHHFLVARGLGLGNATAKFSLVVCAAQLQLLNRRNALGIALLLVGGATGPCRWLLLGKLPLVQHLGNQALHELAALPNEVVHVLG